jgi:hypothetical protein
MIIQTRQAKENDGMKSYPIFLEDDLGSKSWMNNFLWLFYMAVIGVALIVVIIAGGVTAVQRIITTGGRNLCQEEKL